MYNIISTLWSEYMYEQPLGIKGGKRRGDGKDLNLETQNLWISNLTSKLNV